MEKDSLFSNSCFPNSNWDQSMDQNSNFNSALSSIVSSPSNNHPNTATDTAMIGELIGRLGSICNSGEISPQSHHYLIGGNNTNGNSTNKSCYSIPLNSPQELNLSAMEHHHHAQPNFFVPGNASLPPPAHLASLAVDPGFRERAARFSCLGAVGLPPATVGSHMGISEIPIQGGPQIDMEMRPYFNNVASHDRTVDDGQLRSISDEPLASGHMVVTRSNSRKRKTTPKGRAKEEILKVSQEESLSTKRTKSLETGKNDNNLKVEKSNSASSGKSSDKKENNQNPSEPLKQDYIHVRARRGQATDSHSLAERVRREKISERMKFLQDLVPGCNKITGKAVMLDEIINYVQSLQRQVEFLSMKLATVNPLLDFNTENLFEKDIHQSRGSLPLAYPPENLTQMSTFVSQPSSNASMMTSGLENQCGVNSLDSTLKRSLPMLDGFGVPSSQLGTFWNDELNNVFQMGYGQNQDFSSTTLQGTIPTTHMKVEM